MTPPGGNRFEAFFADDAYVRLKNRLYNYLLRRRAVRQCLEPQAGGWILEVGSGLSPMTEVSDRTVYSELSFAALRTLKGRGGKGGYVVADAERLPFRTGAFSRVICSEVLEHLPEDRQALREIASILTREGKLILTFPHRRSYFARDDRFVNHLRRYELAEMTARLDEAGLETTRIEKVLGPLEKLTAVAFVTLIPLVEGARKRRRRFRGSEGALPPRWSVSLFGAVNRLYAGVIWLDARLAPRRFSSVLLIGAIRRP